MATDRPDLRLGSQRGESCVGGYVTGPSDDVVQRMPTRAEGWPVDVAGAVADADEFLSPGALASPLRSRSAPAQ